MFHVSSLVGCGDRDRVGSGIVGSLSIPEAVVRAWTKSGSSTGSQADELPPGHRATLARIAASKRLPNGAALVEVTREDLLDLSAECTARLLFDAPDLATAGQTSKAMRQQLIDLAAAADRLRKAA